ncbi:MAG TPA: DinB family protein [Candidatus Eremiobacteraceae bacterium]|nr:DinB family protein [Candidatus Eremiobacteraceae bacterium]
MTDAKMADLAQTIAEDLAAYYEMVREQVHHWAGSLTAEQLWRKPYPYGNSIGHLILHLTGNLSYYIGARVAETGYVRNRDVEFTEPRPIPKEEVFGAFDKAIAMVIETIRHQKQEDWLKPYSAEREPEAKERFNIFLRSAGHAYHHVGQIIYLANELKK